MAEVTVSQFADVLKVPVETLLSQLENAGIKVTGSEDKISEDAKLLLLTYLRKSHGENDGGKAGAAPEKITLKRKSQSEIKLSGSQGRSRTVNVEIRKKRTYVQRDVLEADAIKKQDALDKEIREKENTEIEKKKNDELEIKKEELEQKKKIVAAEKQKIEDLEKSKPKQPLKTEKKEKSKDGQKESPSKKDLKQKKQSRKKLKSSETRYGRKELHVADHKSGRRKRKTVVRRRRISVGSDAQHGFEKPTEPVIHEVYIPSNIAISDLAQRMAIKGNELVKALFDLGVIVTINQIIDQDTAILAVEELGHVAKATQDEDIDISFISDDEVEGELKSRPPIVTMMGHVDHGKTSMLDYIRKTKITDREAGGITQHIGAYNVETDKGAITFLDTPGHAAFTAMRARGSQATDIVVLVVAADDGVKPQTTEAINHARDADVPILVAINKIDKENTDIERIKNDLSSHEIISEEWGGEHLFVNVSAKTGEGIDALLDAILLQAEVMDLKAIYDGSAKGIVIESSLEKGRGSVATLLVQSGSLNHGDMIIAGKEFGRIRNMFNESQNVIKVAGPSIPVVVLGLSNSPISGDDFLVVKDERRAREVAEIRQSKSRESNLAERKIANTEEAFTQMTQDDEKFVPILIKSDVHGSAEALKDALVNLSTDEVIVKVISSGIGGITESDVVLANASKSIIIGFNVRADATARLSIKDTGVDVRYYSVIYEAIDDVKIAMGGLLSPEIRENIVGLAEVKEVFKSPKLGNIAGSIVIEGHVKKSNPIRVLRDNVVIYEGELESLRRFKDDVNEVQSGTECGIGVKNYNDIKIGDQIECYEQLEVARTID